jgi:hypothetical protein
MLFSFERLLAFSLGEGLGAVCGSCTPLRHLSSGCRERRCRGPRSHFASGAFDAFGGMCVKGGDTKRTGYQVRFGTLSVIYTS